MKPVYLNHRHRKIKDKILVTNDYFNWLFLTDDEFSKLKSKTVKKDSQLYRNLVDQKFIIDPSNNKINEIVGLKYNHSSSVFLGPSLHIIVLTKRCNQQCVYCHAAATPESDPKKYDLSRENAKKIVDLVMTSPNDCITIEFQGGEPLLNFEILKFIFEYSQELNQKREKESQKDLQFSVVTNLEAMDNEKFNYLIKNKIGICTSLDGPEFLHDRNRPSLSGESSHAKAEYWIKRAKEKGIVLGTLLTVSKEALKYPEEIVDEYIRLGYNSIHLRELNYLGKAIGSWKNTGYTADQFLEFWKQAFYYILSLNKKGIFISERTSTIMLQKIINKEDPHYLDLASPCGAIIGQVAYNYDGKIYTCDEARTINEDLFQIGDINGDDINEKNDSRIKDIATKDKSLQIISSTINDGYYCDYCAYKAYCGVCPVCNFMETGNLITDVLRSSRCKVLMGIFDILFEELLREESREILLKWVNKKIYKDKNVCL